MEGRESKGPPAPADLLVCFPSRARLALMPKPICSPARPSEPNKQHRRSRRHCLKKSSNKWVVGGQASSPLLWAKIKPMGSEINEPTSPRVTCAGQIKARPKSACSSSCKNWQSVMEEIERHHNKKKKRANNWVEALGFKKDVMQFLTCLRRIKCDFQCFGSFPSADFNSDDEKEHDDEEEECKENGIIENETTSRTFSKWFMVLQEDHQEKKQRRGRGREKLKSHEEEEEPVVRCCSCSTTTKCTVTHAL